MARSGKRQVFKHVETAQQRAPSYRRFVAADGMMWTALSAKSIVRSPELWKALGEHHRLTNALRFLIVASHEIEGDKHYRLILTSKAKTAMHPEEILRASGLDAATARLTVRALMDLGLVVAKENQFWVSMDYYGVGVAGRLYTRNELTDGLRIPADEPTIDREAMMIGNKHVDQLNQALLVLQDLAEREAERVENDFAVIRTNYSVHQRLIDKVGCSKAVASRITRELAALSLASNRSLGQGNREWRVRMDKVTITADDVAKMRRGSAAARRRETGGRLGAAAVKANVAVGPFADEETELNSEQAAQVIAMLADRIDELERLVTSLRERADSLESELAAEKAKPGATVRVSNSVLESVTSKLKNARST